MLYTPVASGPSTVIVPSFLAVECFEPCFNAAIPTEPVESPILTVPSFTTLASFVATIPKLFLDMFVPSLSISIVAPALLVAIAYLVSAPDVELPLAIIPIAPCPVSLISFLLITSVFPALAPS